VPPAANETKLNNSGRSDRP